MFMNEKHSFYKTVTSQSISQGNPNGNHFYSKVLKNLDSEIYMKE